MHDNDSLHHRLRPSSAAGGARSHWDIMMTNRTKNDHASRPQKTARCCHNSTVLITLTILTTGLAAYLITVTVSRSHHPKDYPKIMSTESANYSSQALNKEHQIDFEDDQDHDHQRQEESEKIVTQLKEPLSLSSDIVTTRVRPAGELHTGENLKRIKDKLGQLKRADLIKLLEMIQQRINLKIIRKRQVANPSPIGSQSDQIPRSSETQRLVADMKQIDTKSPTAPGNKTELLVVRRSKRMEMLMSYLDKIEAAMPQLNASALERIAALEDEEPKPVVRVMKPNELDAVMLQANSSELHHRQASPSKVVIVRPQRALTLGSAVELPASWREPVSSVAPQQGQDWPEDEQQPEVIEDWPSPTETPVVISTTQRPHNNNNNKKRKRKKLRTTTTTPEPEPTTTFRPPTTPAPPTASEEIWIEEEEDIVRPPKKKTKKYKKKTSPPPPTSTTTTTTTTTTTSTTTTPAPVTSSTQQPAIIEDWPEEESWPEQEQQDVSTKAPKLWPSQPQQEQQKWPEEEWLNALRDDIQNRLHIVYA